MRTQAHQQCESPIDIRKLCKLRKVAGNLRATLTTRNKIVDEIEWNEHWKRKKKLKRSVQCLLHDDTDIFRRDFVRSAKQKWKKRRSKKRLKGKTAVGCYAPHQAPTFIYMFSSYFFPSFETLLSPEIVVDLWILCGRFKSRLVVCPSVQ